MCAKDIVRQSKVFPAVAKMSLTVCVQRTSASCFLSQMEQISLFGKGDLSITESGMNSVCVCVVHSRHPFAFEMAKVGRKYFEDMNRNTELRTLESGCTCACVCVCVLGVASNVRIFF